MGLLTVVQGRDHAAVGAAHPHRGGLCVQPHLAVDLGRVEQLEAVDAEHDRARRLPSHPPEASDVVVLEDRDHREASGVHIGTRTDPVPRFIEKSR